MPAIPQSYVDAKPAMDAAAAASTGPKTLVCIFLFGGADTHNMYIPLEGNNRSLYDQWRPSTDASVALRVGVQAAEISAAGSQLGTSPNWGLHPKLKTNHGPAGKSFHSFWADGQMAIIRNVGTLNRPTTRDEYLAGLNNIRPDNLFAHNIQQDIWQAALRHRELRTTGWFGRLANLMDPSFNVGQTVEAGNYSTSGNRLQSFMYGDANPNIIPPTQMISGTSYTGASNFSTRVYKMYHANAQASPVVPPNNYLFTQPYSPINAMHNAQRDNFISAIRTQESVNTNLLAFDGTNNVTPGPLDAHFNTTNMPPVLDLAGVSRANPFRSQLQAAARAIYSRTRTSGAELEQQRQVIMISVGGWDNHLNLRTGQDYLLEHLSIGLAGFWDALRQINVQGTSTPLTDTVVVFTETEFGRTFKANTTLGTDHAWAGHHFVIGSSANVKAGVYGPEPDYTIGANRDVNTNLGRYIPDVSTDQYYATLLKWFGVPTAQIPLVLPNITNFETWDVGFLK